MSRNQTNQSGRIRQETAHQRSDHRSNGSHLNLEQQKKRAKDLLQAIKTGDDAAWQRFQRHHPQMRRYSLGQLSGPASRAKSGAKSGPDAFQPRLNDAQLVIARELGLPSWPRLKAHIQRLDWVRQQISLGLEATPDADSSTLHLRCGSDIQQGLAIAGFRGDFLEFADPYCQGPVPPDTDMQAFLATRAGFIAAAYGIALNDAQARLQQEYSRLVQTYRYDRVVLWFEHDPYDQLILARVLSQFYRTAQRPRQLELICVGQFPGIPRFVGLGQLSPEALRSLWATRQTVTAQHLELGDRVWRALTSPSPDALYRIAIASTPPMPLMAQALMRHLQELPGSQDGLSLTLRLTLALLAEYDSQPAAQLFRRLNQEREPLPYLGDTMYWQVLAELAEGDRPSISVSPDSQTLPWPERVLRLTADGRSQMQGNLHWLALHPGDRWIGGVHISSSGPVWMWDQRRQQPRLLDRPGQ